MTEESTKQFSYKQSGATGAEIHRGASVVCEIIGMRLCNVRFAEGGSILIGSDVGIPLYWMQYANHQHPDRNSASNGTVSLVASDADRIVVRVTGTNQAREIESVMDLTVEFHPATNACTYRFDATLTVLPGKAWHVTPNPDHGELEFFNLYPLDAFTGDTGRTKQYQACYVRQGGVVTRIPHHHLETSDKHSIPLHKGDGFFWLMESENPAVEILSEQEVSAGLCAYMWDAHFGYRVPHGGAPVALQGPLQFSAAWKLYRIERDQAEDIVRQAREGDPGGLDSTPIYVEGVNRFSRVPPDSLRERHDLWPWSPSVISGDVRLSVDRGLGYDDLDSLHIESREEGHAEWVATTLGPAFGGKAFHPGKRHRLRAYVRTTDLEGMARIAIRLHRKDRPGLFDVSTYERFGSTVTLTGTNEWTRIEVVTPEISPEPDRLHLILEHQGSGKSWFDNILYEEIE